MGVSMEAQHEWAVSASVGPRDWETSHKTIEDFETLHRGPQRTAGLPVLRPFQKGK